MARAYSTFANGGNRIDGSILGNVPRAITQIGTEEQERGRPAPRPQPDEDGDPELDPAEGRHRGHGPPRRAPRPARRRQDRDDRELRRRVVRRLRAATDRRRLGRLPARAEADGDRVPRRSGRRRDVPGRDLAHVHGEGAAVSQGPSRSRSRPPTSRTASPQRGRLPRRASSSSTTGTATRAETCSSSQARSRARPRTASRTRSTFRIWSAQPLQAARARLAGQPLTPAIVYTAATAGQQGQRRARPEAEAGAAVGVRPRDARRREADARRRAAARRAARGPGAAQVERRGLQVRGRGGGQGPAGDGSSSSCRGPASPPRPGCMIRIAVAA